MRTLGFQIETVEKFNSFTKQRKDLFGIIDMIAISAEKTIGVQSTSQGSHDEHIKKLYWWPVEDQDGNRIGRTPNLNSKAWLSAGRELWLICWAKKKLKRGGVAFRYEPLVTKIVVADLERVWLEQSGNGSLCSNTAEDCQNHPGNSQESRSLGTENTCSNEFLATLS